MAGERGESFWFLVYGLWFMVYGSYRSMFTIGNVQYLLPIDY